MKSLSRRQAQIDKIAEFIKHHNESTASQAVCRRILGREIYGINDAILNDLVDALNAADEQEVRACYSIIS